VLADDKTHRISTLIVHRGQWLQRGEDLVVPADGWNLSRTRTSGCA
jgi:hypothetical protein